MRRRNTNSGQTLRAFGPPVAKLLATLFLLSVVTFLATSAVPSDPARIALGRMATEEQLEAFRAQQGLDRPVVERYVYWLGNFVQGDWGRSVINERPVREEVTTRLQRTVLLATTSFFLLAVPIGLAIGLFAGARAGRRSDLGVSIGTLIVGSLPEFVIGVLLLVTFAVLLGWLPVESSSIAFGLPLHQLGLAMVLPAATLALTVIPYVIRMTRASTREVLTQPYIQAAELRGIRGARLTRRHVLPNALIPVVNVLALNLAELMAGVVVVEAVFAYPGAGQLLVSAVEAKDIPTVQALAILIGAFFITANLAADLVLRFLNPKLRTG